MANIVIPHPFAPNTTAKASEVNDNFTAVTIQVNGNLDSGNLANNAVTTAKIGDTQVTNAKVASGLDASKLTTGTLPIARIADGAVANAKLASDLDAAKLTTGTLPIARIADGAISTAKIGNTQVTNAKLGSDLDASKLTAGTLPIARIADGEVSNAKLANVATSTIKGRLAAGSGAPTDLTAGDVRTLINVAAGANNYSHPNHSGDVTSAGDGATTIANDAVSNTKLADMAVNTIKGRVSAGTGDPQDLTAANVRTILNVADGANNYAHPNHTGDVTSTGDGATVIANGAVTNDKLAATGLDAGKLTVGTLPIARIADGAITTAKIGDTQVTNVKLDSGIDAGKITTGTLPIARIGANAIDAAKIIATGLSGYVVKFSGSQLNGTGTNSFNNTTGFVSSVMINDYTPASSLNILVLVYSALVKLERTNAGTTMGVEFNLTTGNTGSTAITGTTTLLESTFASATAVDTQRITMVALISAGSSAARNYGFQYKVLGSNQQATILRSLSRDQMLVLELAV